MRDRLLAVLRVGVAHGWINTVDVDGLDSDDRIGRRLTVRVDQGTGSAARLEEVGSRISAYLIELERESLRAKWSIRLSPAPLTERARVERELGLRPAEPRPWITFPEFGADYRVAHD